jgi:transcriptional regulator with GAF, ATPase, and Fis domain
MTLIPFSQAPADIEPLQVDRLAAAMASRFARLQLDGIGPSIIEAVEQVARLVGVDTGALIELDDRGAVATTHIWPRQPGTDQAADALPSWVVGRLARREVVAVARPEDLPAELRGAGWNATAWAGLGLPIVIGADTVCALVLSSRRTVRPWSEHLIDSLRPIVEILSVAVQRAGQQARLRASLATIERLNVRLAADNVYLQEEIKTYHDFDDIVGESAALRLALNRLGQVAPMNASVLLLGETGTGKELFARAAHDRSRRRSRALVRVNCAALPPTLVESELFGHEKGAFTGAVAARQGRFELADGGTIFLDEIGDLAQDIQVKLLRVLQEGEFERVGSSRTRRVDVRVIAATHRDLDADIAAGRFRADLYYRLSVFPIVLPALRERREDIPSLVWFFINRHERELGRRFTRVPQSVMQALQQHAWPGNVRELENVIERAMIQSSGDTLHLDESFGRARRPAIEAAQPSGDRMDAIQRAHIEGILAQCGWRINGVNNAAERLGMHPNTLRFRMKKLGIVCPHRQRRPVAGWLNES